MKHGTKAGGNTRSVMLRVRVTVAEKEKLDKRSSDAGLSLSDWIRSKAIDSKPLLKKPTPDRELLLKFLAAFGKAGSNLNQVARQLNRKQGAEDCELPLRTIAYVLDEIRDISKKLREVFNHGR